MRLLATHVVHHPGGEKYLRLLQGDLSAIPSGQAVDLLVVSAFPNDYAPTPSSLIGALARRGISVGALARDKEVDLRGSFSSWLSHDLSSTYPDAGFRRLLCFETIGAASPAESVGDVFRALMPHTLGDTGIHSIAMPILASGDQGYSPITMLRAIFSAAVAWLGAGLPVRTIDLVVHEDHQSAALEAAFLELSPPARPDRPAPTAPESVPDSPHDLPYDLFVSYAHEDVDAVDALVAALKREPPLRTFQDKLELNVGESWQFELDRALESCRKVVVIYSEAYLRSKMCIEEFNMARLRHRESASPILMPLYLRSASLPLYMRSLQYIDCREADPDRIAAAAEQLRIALGS